MIIRLRKKRRSPLDLETHVNQYVRSFNSPSVPQLPQIKIEPSNFLDVNLALDQDEDLDELYSEDEDFENEEEEFDDEEDDEEYKPGSDLITGKFPIKRAIQSTSGVNE